MPKKGVRSRVYTMSERAAALATMNAEGLAAAAKKTGIPKTTIHKWAKEDNLETSSPEVAERQRAAAAASVTSRLESVAKTKERMVELLSQIAQLAAEAEIELIISRAAHLNEIVGARTRAIHDLQLLEGRATERTEINATTEDMLSLQDDLRRRMA